MKKTSLCVAAAAVIAATLTVHVASAGESPTAPGALQVAVAEYNLGDTAFRRDGFTAEIAGVVHYPVEKGVRPLIVMQHGLFETCADPVAGPAFAAARLALYGPSREQDPAERERLGKVLAEAHPKLSGWPCAQGVDPVRSYRGYDYLGRQLASHGFVVVSIGANGINAGSPEGGDDFPVRAALLNRHLELWQRGELKTFDSDGAPVDVNGRVDVTNVGTLGHSRGGRAVLNHAAHPETWPAGVRIKAVVPVEPVLPGGDEDVTGIPFAPVIGACDSVSNPSARDYVDRVRDRNTVPLHLWTVRGANHNFFNSQWSPQENPMLGVDDAHVDAFADPAPPGACATPDGQEPQLSEAAQRRIGLGYISAFYRRYLLGDRTFDALLAGTEHPLGAVDVEQFPPA